MSIISKVINFFVKDSAERRRFVDEFNVKAKQSFQTMFIDTLFEAMSCEGAQLPEFRHELSAPRAVSGFRIIAKAGEEIPVEAIMALGAMILSDSVLVRRLYLLHWDTLYVADARTGKSVYWKIKDFINVRGLLGNGNGFNIGGLLG